jgi:hypothetical protein
MQISPLLLTTFFCQNHSMQAQWIGSRIQLTKKLICPGLPDREGKTPPASLPKNMPFNSRWQDIF